jgi:hypothetical protein
MKVLGKMLERSIRLSLQQMKVSGLTHWIEQVSGPMLESGRFIRREVAILQPGIARWSSSP